MLLEKAIFRPEAENQKRLEFFGQQRGFFVEVGASDPVDLSQTYTLEAAGWSGILVEPLPHQADLLRARRSARVFQYACSSPNDAGKAVPFFVAGIYSSLKSELPTPKVKPKTSITVETRTLDQLLEESNAPCPIDFVSLDVEGMEIDVLDGFSLEKWKPRLLVVEDRALDFALHNYLVGKGYRWIKRFALNNWYVPANSKEGVSLFGWLQFVRKYYLGLPFRRWRRSRSMAAARVDGNTSTA